MRAEADIKKYRSYRTTPVLMAFFVTMLMCLAVAAYAGLAPFGDSSLVISDADTQYTSFLMYFRDVMLGRQSPFYALEMSVGGNTIGLLGYYAVSPFNILFLLFPPEKLTLAYHLIIMLKLCSASLCLGIYFKNTSGIRPLSLVFTTAYGLCAYAICYSWCIMWLDGLIFLPLIALGLRKLTADRKPALYIFSLAAAIITNYYIGFILCIFSVIFWIYLNIESGSKPGIRAIADFSLPSLLAGGLSAFLLIPVLMSMQDGKRRPFSETLNSYEMSTADVAEHILNKLIPEIPEKVSEILPELIFPGIIALLAVLIIIFCSRRIKRSVKTAIFTAVFILLIIYGAIYESGGFFLHKMLTGFCDAQEMAEGYPHIYSGILCFVLAVFYFTCPETERKEKRAALFVLLLLMLSMHLFLPNIIWHGFTKNNCFNYRYSFIFSFFIICLAHRALDNISAFRLRHGAVITGFALLIIFLGKIYDRKLASDFRYIMLLAEIALMCVLLQIWGKTGGRKGIAARTAVCIISAASIFAQAGAGIKMLSSDTSYAASSAALHEAKVCADRINERDGGLFRAQVHKLINGPMLLGCKGASHFSSNEKKSTVQFMDKLGIANLPEIWASNTYGRTGAFDCFFGFKYADEGQQKDFYEPLDRDIYINPLALPMVFEADAGAETKSLDSLDAFENQNSLFRACFPQVKRDVFTKQQNVSKTYIGLEQSGENDYYPEEGSEEGQLIYSFQAESSDPLYFYSQGCRERGGELWLNGEYLCSYDNCYSWRCIYLGRFEKGENVELSVRLRNESSYPLTDTGCFAYESEEALGLYKAAEEQNSCTVQAPEDSFLKAEISAEEENSCLLCTIAYEPQWTAYVDGVKTETVPAFGSLLSVPVDRGEHSVELIYRPAGIGAGTVISLLSLLGAAGLCLKGLSKKRKIKEEDI